MDRWQQFLKVNSFSTKQGGLKNSIFDPCDCTNTVCTCLPVKKVTRIHDVLPPEDILSRNEILSCCSMCGKTENLISCGTFSVCKEGKCSDRFRGYHFRTGIKKCLSFGIPYIWKSDFASDKSYRAEHCIPLPLRQLDDHGKVINLVCCFCGAQSSKVVAHPRIPKPYGCNTFCKNKDCFNSFTSKK
jgi:hypothetical protein